MNTKQITGTVRFQEIEGGFWGIIGDDGKKYDPIDGLPNIYAVEGLKVSITYCPASVMTTRMWGRTIEIITIEAINEAPTQ